MFKKRLFHLILITLPLSLFAKPSQLTLRDTKPMMQQLCQFHIENQGVNSELIRRMMHLYMENYDPQKIYLTELEIDQYSTISSKKADQVLERVRRGDFSDFLNLHTELKKSVYRARKARGDHIISLKKSNFPIASVLRGPYSTYAKNDAELSKRQAAIVDSWLYKESKQPDFTSYSPQEKLKALHMADARMHQSENPTLFQDNAGSPFPIAQKEHAFTLNVLKIFANSLDPHTAFFSEQEALNMKSSLQSEFRGLGVVLDESARGVYIARIIPKSPAAECGKIRPGDRILRINDENVEKQSFRYVSKAIQKDHGGVVRLTLIHPQETRSITVHLTKKPIILDDQRLSLKEVPYQDGVIGVLRFDLFYDNGKGLSLESDMKKAIMQMESRHKVYGLVLDMRANPGGFLTQAVKVCGVFVPKGLIVITKYSTGEIAYNRDLDGRKSFNRPVVVLTSKASGSASEVVAQALQDYGVAVVVGDKQTYGKGSMQIQNITSDQSKAKALYKITVGRYYTVSGRSTQLQGVKADIHVPTHYAPFKIGERYLNYPISCKHLGFSLLDQSKERTATSASQPVYHTKPIVKWQVILPELQKKSRQRIASDSQYQGFLNKIHKIQSKQSGVDQEYLQLQDLPVKEAVNIVKDMHQMDAARR